MVDRGDSQGTSYGAYRENQTESGGRDGITVSKARLETVLETAVDAIIVTNDHARILMCNKACEELFGYGSGDVIGQKATMFMEDHHAERHDDSVAEYLAHGKEGVIGEAHELSARHKDGTIIPIELSIGEADTPAGRQFIGVIRDLRPRQAAKAHLDEMQQQLLHLSRRNAVDEMGAAMAHELNQPLTALTLYLQAIEKKNKALPSLSPDMDEILQKALREVTRVGDIVQRMRRFGKQSAMKSTVADIKQLIQDAVELTMIGYRFRNLKIISNIADDLPRLKVDPVQIEQILVNLLRNAIEAVEGQTNGRIVVTASVENKYLVISVNDSGAGIADEVREQLFRTFSSSKETGMGLGLVISNAIAQSHGGFFEVDPGGNGRGATFTLKLPTGNSGMPDKGERV